MAIIRKKELKGMGKEALEARLFEVRKELNTEHGLVMRGGRSSNPGRIKELRHTVARILTYLHQKARATAGKKGSRAAKGAAPKTGAPSAPNDKAKENKAMTPAGAKPSGQPTQAR